MEFKKNCRKCKGKMMMKQEGGPAFNEDSYKAFGADANTAFKEGWMPQASTQGATTYYNRYGLLNSVNVPNDNRKGHLALVGHNNGMFDIVTQDADGKNFGEYIQRNGNLQDVNKYFASANSPIKKRADSIIDGTYAKTQYQEGGNIKQVQGNKLFAFRDGLGTKMIDLHSRFPIQSTDGNNYFYNYSTSNGEQSIMPEQDVINQANENNFRGIKPFLLKNKGVTDTLYMQNGVHVNDLPPFGSGGDINIKKSHKGRFTDYLKRTGKTAEEALHSDDPHVRKMAQFAINARKWKH